MDRKVLQQRNWKVLNTNYIEFHSTIILCDAGVRDGSVAENASYYVLTQAPDGVFEAIPVHEQYSFKSIGNCQTLSYEEAEKEINGRKRVHNLFNVMVRKRMKKSEGDADEESESNEKGKKKAEG